jgi:hypothetical protein
LQKLYCLSHASIPFALIILEIESCFLLRLTWTTIYCCWDDRQVLPCPAFFHWDGVWHTLFAWIGLEPPASPSQPPSNN